VGDERVRGGTYGDIESVLGGYGIGDGGDDCASYTATSFRDNPSMEGRNDSLVLASEHRDRLTILERISRKPARHTQD